MKKYLSLYCLILIATQFILTLDSVQPALVSVSTLIANTAGIILSQFDNNFIQNALILRHIDSGISIRVDQSCNAIQLMTLLGAAILAFPTTLRIKLIGLAGGLTAIQLVNVVRVISLFYVIAMFPNWFDWIHEYLWVFLMVVDGTLCFWMWVSYNNYQGSKQVESA